TSLAAADPYNADAWQELGAAEVATHRYSQAVDAYRKATDVQPDDGNLWNQLAYAAAYAGDAATATNAIERYRRVQPQSPNPIDSLGDVHLILGHLRQAEEVYSQNARKF